MTGYSEAPQWSDLFMGAEAEEMYEHLTGQKVGVVRDE